VVLPKIFPKFHICWCWSMKAVPAVNSSLKRCYRPIYGPNFEILAELNKFWIPSSQESGECSWSARYNVVPWGHCLLDRHRINDIRFNQCCPGISLCLDFEPNREDTCCVSHSYEAWHYYGQRQAVYIWFEASVKGAFLVERGEPRLVQHAISFSEQYLLTIWIFSEMPHKIKAG